MLKKSLTLGLLRPPFWVDADAFCRGGENLIYLFRFDKPRGVQNLQSGNRRHHHAQRCQVVLAQQ
jgi:hypothetical protein